MYWLILPALLCGLAVLPLGFRAVYREQGAIVWLLIGPLKFPVYPGKGKTKKVKNKKAKNKKENSQQNKTGSGNTASQKGGSYRDFLPIVRTILEFLRNFRRKLRVNDLQLKITLAGDDPGDLAINYGRAWTALGNLIPHIERYFIVKKRELDVACDFTAEKTLIYAKLDFTIAVARLLHLLTRHGIEILKHFAKIKKLRKGGAKI